jgi:hypothetical protein
LFAVAVLFVSVDFDWESYEALAIHRNGRTASEHSGGSSRAGGAD